MSSQLKLTDPTLSRKSAPTARARVFPDRSITTSSVERRQSQSKLVNHEPQPRPVTFVRRLKTSREQGAPTPQEKSSVAIYVAVDEAEAEPKPELGFTREFMRHSGLVVQPYPNINQFYLHHITGKPLGPLTYECILSRDPRESMRNLSFDLVARIPRPKLWSLEPLFKTTKPRVFQLVKGQPTKSWNSQMFVVECLHKMVAAGLMTEQEMKSAIDMQQRAVNTPWAGDYPNLNALAREHSDKFIP